MCILLYSQYIHFYNGVIIIIIIIINEFHRDATLKQNFKAAESKV